MGRLRLGASPAGWCRTPPCQSTTKRIDRSIFYRYFPKKTLTRENELCYPGDASCNSYRTGVRSDSVRAAQRGPPSRPEVEDGRAHRTVRRKPVRHPGGADPPDGAGLLIATPQRGF